MAVNQDFKIDAEPKKGKKKSKEKVEIRKLLQPSYFSEKLSKVRFVIEIGRASCRERV